MSIELTEQQQQALDTVHDGPPRLVDPRTNAAYVLVPAEEYENIREILEEERRRKAPSIMSKLRTIKIEAPADFAANLDLYLSGEKRVEDNLH